MKAVITIVLLNCLYLHTLYSMDSLSNSLSQLQRALLSLEQKLQISIQPASFKKSTPGIFKYPISTVSRQDLQRAYSQQPSIPSQGQAASQPRLESNLVPTAQHGETIIRGKFVEDILGMSEEEFRNRYGWNNKNLQDSFMNGRLTNSPFIFGGSPLFGRLPQDVIAWIKQYPRRAAIFQGEFEYATNEQLLQKINGSKARQFAFPRKFVMRIHDPEFPNPTDIRYLQADPVNQYASFQVASTFFGPLEGGMIKFDNPLGLTNSLGKGMFEGAAQGEEASIAVGGATIYRKYIMPTLRIAQGNPFGYYYLLQDIRLRNGTLKLPWHFTGYAATIIEEKAKEYEPKMIQKDLNAFKKDINHVGIGNHKYVVVTSGGGTFGSYKPTEKDVQEKLNFDVDLTTGKVDPRNAQLVHQIFSAAYSLNPGRRKKTFNLNQKTLARMVSQASYIGNVRAAYLNALETGQNTLFLTLMGAGAFENPIDWVAESIELVKNEMQYYNLNVYLLYRNDAHKFHRKADTDKKFIINMIRIMDETNGTFHSSNQQLLGYVDGYIDAAFTNKNKQREAQYADAINRILDPYYPAKVASVPLTRGQDEGWVVTDGPGAVRQQPRQYQASQPVGDDDEGWIVTTPPPKRGSWRKSRRGN